MKFCRWQKLTSHWPQVRSPHAQCRSNACQLAGIGIALRSEKGGPLVSTTSARFTSSSPAITRKPGRSASLDTDVHQLGIQLYQRCLSAKIRPLFPVCVITEPASYEKDATRRVGLNRPECSRVVLASLADYCR